MRLYIIRCPVPFEIGFDLLHCHGIRMENVSVSDLFCLLAAAKLGLHLLQLSRRGRGSECNHKLIFVIVACLFVIVSRFYSYVAMCISVNRFNLVFTFLRIWN
ncbi:hypothetical protein D3C71_1367980 [compost metagenome]